MLTKEQVKALPKGFNAVPRTSMPRPIKARPMNNRKRTRGRLVMQQMVDGKSIYHNRVFMKYATLRGIKEKAAEAEKSKEEDND